MSQPSKNARREYENGIVNDAPTRVSIPGTKRTVSLRGIKPYTLEKLTDLWIEREATIPDDSSETLRSMCKEPYFSIKEACLMVLNTYWKIRLIYPLMWRIWAYVREYTDEQMLPIVMEGKKKLQLTAHWMVMAYSVDMRTDWMKMTAKEAEQYRAELLSEASRLSLRNTPATEGRGDSSSD